MKRTILKLCFRAIELLCQLLFVVFLFRLIMYYSTFFAVCGGVLLLLWLLYPNEYKRTKKKIYARVFNR